MIPGVNILTVSVPDVMNWLFFGLHFIVIFYSNGRTLNLAYKFYAVNQSFDLREIDKSLLTIESKTRVYFKNIKISKDLTFNVGLFPFNFSKSPM